MTFPVDLPFKHQQKAHALKILAHDIEEAFVRGGGSGGQKINKTSSCVHLKHLPTGTEVKVQRHREQSKNRLSAYKLLIDKIEHAVKGEESERSQKIFKLKKQKARRSRRSKEKILEEKRHRAQTKTARRKPSLPREDEL